MASGNYTPSEISEILRSNADKVAGMSGNSFTNYYGYGRVNAYKSINPARFSGLSFSSLGLSPSGTKVVGQQLKAALTVTNNNAVPLTLERLKVDIRGTGDSQDIVGGSGITLAPGQSINLSSYDADRFLSDNGTYAARAVVRYGGVWHKVGNTLALTVRNPRASDFLLSPTVKIIPNPVIHGRTIRGTFGLTSRVSGEMILSRVKLEVKSSRYNQSFSGYTNRVLSKGSQMSYDQQRIIYYRGTYSVRAVLNIQGRWLVIFPTVSLAVK